MLSLSTPFGLSSLRARLIRCVFLAMVVLSPLCASAKTEYIVTGKWYGANCTTGFVGKKYSGPSEILGDCNAYATANALYPGNPYSQWTVLVLSNARPHPQTSTLDGEPTTWVADLLRLDRDGVDHSVMGAGLAALGYECPTSGWAGPAVGVDSAMLAISSCVRTTADPPTQDCQKCGNPVAFEGGIKIEEDTDYRSRTGQKHKRTYRSDRNTYTHLRQLYVHQPPVAGGGGATCYPGTGKDSGLPHCFAYTGPGTNKLEVRRPNALRQQVFNATTLVANTPDLIDRVNTNPGGGWQVRNGETDTLETYDATGKLVAQQSPSGQTETITTVGTTMTATDAFGRSLVISHDANGRLLQFTDPAGGVYSYGYDAKGNQTQVTYPDGKTRLYHFENTVLPHALTGVTDENGHRFSTFTYENATGRPLSTEHAGGVEKYQFNYANYPTNVVITDPLNTVRTMTLASVHGSYKQNGMTQPCGTAGCSGTVSSPLILDANGNVVSRIDFNGAKTTYTYDTTRNLETSRTEGQPPTPTCPNGGTYHTSSYGSACTVGVCLATSPFPGSQSGTPLGLPSHHYACAVPGLAAALRTTTTQWHADWRLPRKVAEPLRITTHAFHGDAGISCAPAGASTALVCRTTVQATTDANGSLGFSATSSGTARISNTTYNSLGQVLTVDGPRTDVSDVTTYDYYPNDPSQGWNRGMLNTVTNALNHVTTFSNFNPHGQPQTIVDPNGLTITLTYDVRTRLTSISANGLNYGLVYDNAGQLDILTLPDGSTLNYDYDQAHRLIRITDGLGNKIEYVLDAMGNRLEEQTFDPSGTLSKLMKREFNNLNRLWKDIGGTSPANQVTESGFDHNGNLKTLKDALNRTTTNTVDSRGRLTKVEDPVNGPASPTLFEYNGQDVLTKVTDPKGLNTTYTYNGHGELLTQVSPDTGTTTFTYDVAGNLASLVDARNVTATGVYDALNRLTTITYPAVGGDPAEVVSAVYDTCTNGKGQLCSVTDKTGTTTWSYDLLGRVTAKSQTVGALTQTTSFTYNAVGQLTQVTTPSNQVIGYGYQNRRPVSITVNGQAVLTEGVYEPFGPVGGWKWGNHTTGSPNLHLRLFDLDYRATEVATDQPLSGSTPVLKRTITWDYVSRITGITDPNSAANSFTYGYDDLDRLTSVTPGGASQLYGYSYDKIGNRLTSTTSGATTTYNYPNPVTSHRLLSLSGAQTKSYTYDAVGNMTTDGVNTWSYGGNNRPYQVTSAAGTTTFAINALGQRVKKAGPSGITRFVYDSQGRLLGEYTDTGALIQETVWFNDLPVATVRPDGTTVAIYYVHPDHLGTPRAITRPSDNQLVWKWETTEPFGNNLPNENPSGLGTFQMHLRHPGQYYDGEVNSFYNYYRDYDPSTGRYRQSDPIGLGGGINTYSYVGGSPIGYADALGLAPGPAVGWMADREPDFGEGFIEAVELLDWFITDVCKIPPIMGGGIVGGLAKTGKMARAARTLRGGVPNDLRGLVDPNTIRFTQDSISTTFRDGRTVQSTINALVAGQRPGSIPAIRVFTGQDGLIYTLDNRRLFAAIQAGVPVNVRPATAREIRRESRKFTTTNNGCIVCVN